MLPIPGCPDLSSSQRPTHPPPPLQPTRVVHRDYPDPSTLRLPHQDLWTHDLYASHDGDTRRVRRVPYPTTGRGKHPKTTRVNTNNKERLDHVQIIASTSGSTTTSLWSVNLDNLHWSQTEKEIQSVFGDPLIGRLAWVRLHYDAAGRSLGRAECRYTTAEAAALAVQTFNGLDIQGTVLHVRMGEQTIHHPPPDPALMGRLGPKSAKGNTASTSLEGTISSRLGARPLALSERLGPAANTLPVKARLGPAPVAIDSPKAPAPTPSIAGRPVLSYQDIAP